MEKFRLLKNIQEVYSRGGNIIQYLKSLDNTDCNTVEDILISYDFQAGSYIKGYYENPEFSNKYCSALAAIINKMGSFNSIMEVGVGEATTLGIVLKYLETIPEDILGFDISWSRLKFAKGFLNDMKFRNVNLFTANLFEIPLADNSVDIVFSSHSIEPNGGFEEAALKEVYRVANSYLILLEPSFELANYEAKARMKQHGYVTCLHKTALKLGYKVSEYRLFDYSSNPLNPTGLMIIEKNKDIAKGRPELQCPISKLKLETLNGTLMNSDDGILSYPIVDGIPCLLKENSILTTHLTTNYEEFKRQNSIELVA